MGRRVAEIDIEKCKSDIISGSKIIKKYERLRKWHTYIILVLVFAVIAAAVFGGIYAKSEDGKWYFILLFAIIGGFAGFAACGVILFVFKPILYIYRRRMFNLQSDVEIQCMLVTEAKCSLLEYYIINTPAHKPRVQKDYAPPSIADLFESWIIDQDGIYRNFCELNELELDEYKFFEWAWILNALAITIVGVLVVVVIKIAISLLVVMILLLGVYLCTANWNTDTYRSYGYDDYGDHRNSESIISNILEGIYHFFTASINRKLSEIQEETNPIRESLKFYKENSKYNSNRLIEYYYPDMDGELVKLLNR